MVIEKIKGVLQLFEGTDLTELELEEKNFKILLFHLIIFQLDSEG